MRVRRALDALIDRAIAARPIRRRSAIGVDEARRADPLRFVAADRRRRALDRLAAGGDTVARRRLARVTLRAVARRLALHADAKRGVAALRRRGAMTVGRAREARARLRIAMERREWTVGVRRATRGGDDVGRGVVRALLIEAKLSVACRDRDAGERGPSRARASARQGASARIASASPRAKPFGNRAR